MKKKRNRKRVSKESHLGQKSVKENLLVTLSDSKKRTSYARIKKSAIDNHPIQYPLRTAPKSKKNASPSHVVQTVELLHPLLPDGDPTSIKVSVVCGTYNRFPLLRRCVESVRDALKDISYEIVICDGGSTDGSYEWLQEQPDVIQLQGDLSGAVPAFNAAARVAKGEFIFAINDDAEVYPDAIGNALAYFDDPLVGQVALTFIEDDQPKIETVYGYTYANFSLTRTNIVRACEEIVGGIWATCYKTYGGDTELSCWVYRFGYKVVGAPNAKVIHREHVDNLRKKNVQSDHQRINFHKRWEGQGHLNFRGPLPRVSKVESEKLQRLQQGETIQTRWSRLSAVDPIPGKYPPRVDLKSERVLHWQLWTPEDPQTSMVAGLRRLGSAGYVGIPWTSVPIQNRGRMFKEAAEQLRPTLIFLQCQDVHAIPVEVLRAVRNDPSRDPSLVVCIWSGDIGPSKGPWEGSGDHWQFVLGSAVDLMLFTGTGQVTCYRQRGMPNAAYLQIGYDVDRYHPGSRDQHGSKHKITFMGQDYGSHFNKVPQSEAQLRRDAVRALHSIEGFVPYGAGFGNNMPQKQSGDIYRQSLMAMSISLTSTLGRYTSDRLFRSMACGCPTLVKRFVDMEGLGLVDGVNCIGWDTTTELLNHVKTWLEPSKREELRQVGQAGADLMQKHHTWDVRMKELQALLNAVRQQA